MKINYACNRATGFALSEGETQWQELIFRLVVSIALVITLNLAAVAADDKKLEINQTEGFGAGGVLVFTYLQNCFCTHQPFDARGVEPGSS